MKNLVLSCLGKTDKIYVEYLETYITEAENYEAKLKVPNVLKPDELKMFEFIIKSHELSGETPSLKLMIAQFPAYSQAFDDAHEVAVTDLRVYMFNLINGRVNKYTSERMAELNAIVKTEGITSEIADEFNRLQGISNRNKAKNIEIDIDAKSIYEEKKNRHIGLRTGVRAVDERIGGMSKGTITTIAGFTSQYKTTWALNIARINSYFLGYNIAYISLETPKEDMNWNLLSSHSFEPTLSKFGFISHDRMRQCKLTPDEEDYLFNVVEPDLHSTIKEPDGTESPRGKIVFLDESDFDSFSFGEITAVLEKVDDMLGGSLDAVIVDYIQLCKFSGSGVAYDANSQINSYVTFFRRLGQSFRKVVDANGVDTTKQLTVILLSQINRENWRRARNNSGRYDITCLADANELERGSYRVFTTYTTEEMKALKNAQVQILKNRTGQTMYEPVVVYADGESYTFMDDDNMNKTFGGNTSGSIEAAFSALDDSDLADILM